MITACNCKIFSTRYEDDTIMNKRAESMLIFLNERFFFNSDRVRSDLLFKLSSACCVATFTGHCTCQVWGIFIVFASIISAFL